MLELGGWSIVNFEIFCMYIKKGSASSKVADRRRFANARQFASGTVNVANWSLQFANCKGRRWYGTYIYWPSGLERLANQSTSLSSIQSNIFQNRGYGIAVLHRTSRFVRRASRRVLCEEILIADLVHSWPFGIGNNRHARISYEP